MKDDRLKTYVICSHVDKTLNEKQIFSVYDVPIQAGAARTDMRTCALHDHDGCPESISDRNLRYSEVTAMWWVAGHLDTPYVGIGHYRRRLKLTDAEISAYLDAGIDLITSTQMVMEYSIEENYRKNLWSTDWDYMMEIMEEYAPEDVAFAGECFSSHQIHLCNMNIMRSEMYREFSDWAFPMLDAFYRRCPAKTDRYLGRDVGFVAERLSHMFVMKMKAEGKRVVEAEIIDLKSNDWSPEKECDTGDFDAVWMACDRLYRDRQITRCSRVLSAAMHKGGDRDERLRHLLEIMVTGIAERAELPQTMHEYLPEELRRDLDTLTATYDGFRKIVLLWHERDDDETANLLSDYRKVTHFSSVAVRCIIETAQQNGTD